MDFVKLVLLFLMSSSFWTTKARHFGFVCVLLSHIWIKQTLQLVLDYLTLVF